MAFAQPMRDPRKQDCTHLMKLTPHTSRNTDFPRYEISYRFERINIRKNEPEKEYPGEMNFSDIPWEPAFLSPLEKYWKDRDPDCLRKNFFKRLAKGGEEELKMLLMPKPQKKAMRFCGSCLNSYQDDYIQHVKSKGHNVKFQNNNFIDLLQKESEGIHKEFERNIMEIIHSAPVEQEEEEETNKILPIPSSKKKVINGHSIENKENIKDSLRNKQVPFQTQPNSNAFVDKQLILNSQTKKKCLPNPKRLNSFQQQERSQNSQRNQFNQTNPSDWRTSLTTPEARFEFLSQQSKNFGFQRSIEEEGEEEGIVLEEVNKKARRQYSFETINNKVVYRDWDPLMNREQNCWNQPNRDFANYNKPQFQKHSPKYQPFVQQNQPQHSDLSELAIRQKQSKKRSYSNTEMDHELLANFKKVKITEGFTSCSQSQSEKGNQDLITLDIKGSKSKWETLNRSFTNLVAYVTGKVKSFCSFKEK